MPRLGRKIALRLRRVAGCEFLPPTITVSIYSLFLFYYSTHIICTGKECRERTLVIFCCLTRVFFLGAIWRGPGLGPRAAGLHLGLR